jgi:hypothetical protein
LNVLDLLKPDTLQGVTHLFLTGYIFRLVEGWVRNRRKETELQSTILAVCWSFIIFTLLAALRMPIPPLIPSKLHLVISVGSSLLASAVLGFVWGRALLFFSERFPTVLPSGYAQTVVQFIRASKDAYVEIKLRDERYQGMIWHFDLDPERFLDLHITLRHPAILLDDEWRELGVEELMFNLKDVTWMGRFKSVDSSPSLDSSISNRKGDELPSASN